MYFIIDCCLFTVLQSLKTLFFLFYHLKKYILDSPQHQPFGSLNIFKSNVKRYPYIMYIIQLFTLWQMSIGRKIRRYVFIKPNFGLFAAQTPTASAATKNPKIKWHAARRPLPKEQD